MFRLEQHTGEPLLLPPDLSILIGRGDQCDLQLNDPSASRMHCRVIARDGKVTLTDVGSRWGTLVNGQYVEQCDLQHGDRIKIGDTELLLVVEGSAGQTTLAPRTELLRPAIVSTSGRRSEVADPALLSDLQAPFRFDDENLVVSAAPESSEHHTLPSQGYSSAPSRQPHEFLGQTFHRYAVQQIVASTTSGIVFKAKESATGQVIALKIFRSNGFTDHQAEQRFERDVRTTVGQKHPNIVELFNAGKWEGLCFTASQLIDGQSAVDMIRRIGIAGMLNPATVLQISLGMCEALRFLEASNIVHRNIMPSNILICNATGTSLLNDLVIAKASVISKDEQLTQDGTFLGDPAYMSPEMLGSGYATDCRSDIFQLGATLYSLLTGRPPFGGGTIGETITQVLNVAPKPIRGFHMATPPQFEAVVQRMLQKNPRDRFQNATELAVSLKHVAAELGQKEIKAFEIDPKATGWRP